MPWAAPSSGMCTCPWKGGVWGWMVFEVLSTPLRFCDSVIPCPWALTGSSGTVFLIAQPGGIFYSDKCRKFVMTWNRKKCSYEGQRNSLISGKFLQLLLSLCQNLTQPSPNSRPGLERAEAACGDTEGSSLPGRLQMCHCKTHPKCIAVKSPSLADFSCGFCDSGASIWSPSCPCMPWSKPSRCFQPFLSLSPAHAWATSQPSPKEKKQRHLHLQAGQMNVPCTNWFDGVNAELFKWEKGRDRRWIKCLTAHRDGTDAGGLFLSCGEKEEPCEAEEKRVWLTVLLAVWDAVMATIKAAPRFSWREALMLQFSDWFCEKGCQDCVRPS